ncbi:MAG: M28 family peptidase [Bacteroidota bacterium]
MRSGSFFLFFLVLSLASCGRAPENGTGDPETPLIDSATIDRHLAELAADKYGGRLPFSEGEQLTLDYLTRELQALGLEPGNGDSYLQEVPMVEITGYPDEIIGMAVPQGDLVWQLGPDYVIYSEKAQEENYVSDSELVFAGFGIVAPEYGWNDYADLDVKGKTVVVMVNDPGYYTEDDALFRGKEMTYYGRWTYKFEEAARQGAAGCLIIHETGAAGYPWFVVESSWSGTRLTLEPDGAPVLDVVGWISLQTAKDLFLASEKSVPGGWFKAATEPDFQAVPLGVELSTGVRNELRFDKSYNVIARLPGAERPEEHVVYTAHWDHIGVGPAVDGDSIYNGALDNASGTSLLLAIAEAYTKEEAPARSVVFLFVTAEEQGLWGSAYYVNNPVFPLTDAVANINIDGINPIGEAADLTITGRGHSEMDALATAVAKTQNRYVQGDPEPEKGYFYRSDHFNFAKAGVPALYAAGGYDHRTRGKEYAQEQRDGFVAERYHQPADEYSAGAWPLGGAVQDGALLYRVGLDLARGERWPTWEKSSEFYVERKR